MRLPRLRRRSPRVHDGELTRVPDDLPRNALLTEPIRVDRITLRDPESLPDGSRRVAFVAVVRDAADARCPDLAVEAEIDGPSRRGQGMTTTDLLGRATFRMSGPGGTYRFRVLDVAAGALAFDREASRLEAELSV